MITHSEFLYPDQLIAASLRNYPDHAIYFGSVNQPKQLSFAELEVRATQLAQTLVHEYGLQPQTKVPVLLPRNGDFIVALYAIWKAGLVFMPLSYSWDYDFLQSRIALSGAKFVIAHSLTQSKVSFRGSAGTTLLMDQWVASSDRLPIVLDERSPQSDAYVYSSSGTTSEPKMIVLPYEGISARIQGINTTMAMDPELDVVMCFCSLGFDASLCEILMALYAGCSLVMAPEYVRLNPLVRLPQFLQTMTSPRPTTTILIPSVLKFISDTNRYPGLRKILTTGERCDIRWVKPLLQKEWQVFNGYGPTETTFGASITPIRLSDAVISLHNAQAMGVKLLLERDETFSALYGRTQCRVFVEGGGMGRYVRRVGAQPEPCAIPQTQRYFTGDLVCQYDDGQLEFTRRIDSMRKIFAQQIDLQRIADKIAGACDQVEAVTLEVEDNILIAYVQAVDPATFDAQAYLHMLETVFETNRTDRYNYDKPSLSFLCDYALKPVGPFTYLTANARQTYPGKLGQNITQIEAIWKRILFSGLTEALCQAVELDITATFTHLGGSSVTVGQMAMEVWQCFGNTLDYGRDWQVFFQGILNDGCSILDLAKQMLVRSLVTSDVLSAPSSVQSIPEAPIFLLGARRSNDFTAISKKFADYRVIVIRVYKELLETVSNDSTFQPFIIDRINGLLRHSQPTNPLAVFVDQSVATESALPWHQFGPIITVRDGFEPIAHALKELRTVSTKQKIAQWHQPIRVAGFLPERCPIYLNRLASYTEIVDVVGAGKSALLRSLLMEYRDVNLIALDMRGCATIDDAFAKLRLTEKELDDIRRQDSVLVLDYAELMSIPSHHHFLCLSRDWRKAKLIVLSRLSMNTLARLHGVEHREYRRQQDQQVLSLSQPRRFGFPDNPLFKAWFRNEQTSIDELLHLLHHWFDYDYQRSHQHAPKHAEFLAFLTTLDQLYLRYAPYGNSFSIEPSQSKWHRSHSEEHAPLALPQFDHILPLLECDDPHQLLYRLPSEWNALCLEFSLCEYWRNQLTSVDSLHSPLPLLDNSLTQSPTRFLKHLPLNDQKSVEVLSYQDNATTLFFVYPLTGDVPKDYYRLSQYLSQYTCIALTMHDEAFYAVSDGRSHDLIKRAQFLAHIIQAIQPMGPYCLLGWSFGALLSYYVAQQLEQRHSGRTTIINIDGSPPLRMPLDDQPARVKHLLQDLAGRYLPTLQPELSDRIDALQIEDLTELFSAVQAFLRRDMIDPNVKLFSEHLRNVEDNLRALYQLDAVDPTPSVCSTMLMIRAGVTRRYINDLRSLADWSHYVELEPPRDFGHLDHFTLLTGEVYAVIAEYCLQMLPSTPLPASLFIHPNHYQSQALKQLRQEATERAKSFLQAEEGQVTVVGAWGERQRQDARAFQQAAMALYLSKMECRMAGDGTEQTRTAMATSIYELALETICRQPVFFCQGMPGSGKTQFCGQLYTQLLNRFDHTKPSLLPVLVANDRFCQSSFGALAKETRLDLKQLLVSRYHTLVFIIDDADAHTMAQINTFATPYTIDHLRFVVTSNHPELAALLSGELEPTQVTIAQPSMTAIRAYCERLDACMPKSTPLFDRLQALILYEPRIKQLLTTPRNVEFLLRRIDNYVEKGLYDTQSLFQVAMHLFESNILANRRQTGVVVRPGLNVREASLNYAKSLAYSIALATQTAEQVQFDFQDTHLQTLDNWLNLSSGGRFATLSLRERYDHNDLDTQALKRLCRVVATGTRWHFEDPLFYHLLLAKQLIDTLSEQTPVTDADGLVKTFSQLDLTQYIETVDFIADYLHANEGAKTQLINNLVFLLYYDPQQDDTLAPRCISSSNALTILARTFHNLGGLSLTNRLFRMVNLDGALLDGAHLQGTTLMADLTRTSMRNALLHQANCTSSKILFGRIALPQAVSCCQISNAGAGLAYVYYDDVSAFVGVWGLHDDCLLLADSFPIQSAFPSIHIVFTPDDNRLFVTIGQVVRLYIRDEGDYQLRPFHIQSPDFSSVCHQVDKQMGDKNFILPIDNQRYLLVKYKSKKGVTIVDIYYDLENDVYVELKTQLLQTNSARHKASREHLHNVYGFVGADIDEMEAIFANKKIKVCQHKSDSFLLWVFNVDAFTLILIPSSYDQMNGHLLKNQRVTLQKSASMMPHEYIFLFGKKVVCLGLNNASIQTANYRSGRTGVHGRITNSVVIESYRLDVVIESYRLDKGLENGVVTLDFEVPSPVNYMQFSHDGVRLFLVLSKELMIWHVGHQRWLSKIPFYVSVIDSFTLSSDAKTLAYTVYDNDKEVIYTRILEETLAQQSEKFIMHGNDARNSLWRLSQYFYEIRVNGSFRNIPLRLQCDSQPVLSKYTSFVAYSNGNQLVILNYLNASQRRTQETSKQPLCFLQDGYLLVGTLAGWDREMAIVSAVYDLEKAILHPIQTEQLIRIRLNVPTPTIQICKDQNATWLVYFDREVWGNRSVLHFFPLSDKEKPAVFHLKDVSELRFHADSKLLGLFDASSLKLYTEDTLLDVANVRSFCFGHLRQSVFVVDSDCHLSKYDVDSSLQQRWLVQMRASTQDRPPVLSQDDQLLVILMDDSTLHLYSAVDGRFYDQLHMSYLALDMTDLSVHITREHDLVVTDRDHRQWYWRAQKNTQSTYWQLVWSATPADSFAATGALMTDDTKLSPGLRNKMTFFGASSDPSRVVMIRTYQQQLLILLQRFYGVGIHGKIESIHWSRDRSHLAIKVDHEHASLLVLHIPLHVIKAAINGCDLDSLITTSPSGFKK